MKNGGFWVTVVVILPFPPPHRCQVPWAPWSFSSWFPRFRMHYYSYSRDLTTTTAHEQVLYFGAMAGICWQIFRCCNRWLRKMCKKKGKFLDDTGTKQTDVVSRNTHSPPSTSIPHPSPRRLIEMFSSHLCVCCKGRSFGKETLRSFGCKAEENRGAAMRCEMRAVGWYWVVRVSPWMDGVFKCCLWSGQTF